MTGTESGPRPTERTFQSLPKQRMAVQTVEAIKEMIRRGDLGPHQALPPERELARALDISRPTLREAIGALTAMNILESHHGDGTFITSLTPQLLAEPINFLLQVDSANLAYLADVRRGLEIEAARLSAARVTAEELGRLEELAEEMATRTGTGFAAADAAFHAAIVAAAHNPILSNLHASVASLEGPRNCALDPAERERAATEHAAILRALRRRAVKAAGDAMVTHLSHGDDADSPETGRGKQ